MPYSHVLIALASFCWAYCLVLFFTWLRAVSRTETRDHVGHAVSLLGVFVPGIVLVYAAMLLGVVFNLPKIAALVVVLFPAGFAAGLHVEVDRLTDPHVAVEAGRVILTTLLAILLTGYNIA